MMIIKRGLVLLLALAYAMGILLVVTAYRSGLAQAESWSSASGAVDATDNQINASLRDIEALTQKMEAMKPVGFYVIVDTAANRLYVKKGDETVKEAIVSCGSGEVLKDPKDPKGKKQWVFDTPRGEFSIKYKIKNPVWVKPDWAFIEEGTPIPARDSEDRVEGGTLGDYALGLGQGYFIHGTLYTRLLGRNVTHGCIRVGDADLEYVYKTIPVGSKVYIY